MPIRKERRLWGHLRTGQDLPKRRLGKVCLATPFQPRQEHIVDPPLLTPGLVKNISLQLLAAKLFQDFTLLTRQFVGSKALLTFHVELLAFDLKFVPLFFQAALPFVSVLEVNGRNTTGGFGRPQTGDFTDPVLALVEFRLNLRHFLKDFSQRDVFAMFQVLSVLQHCGKGKSEGHDQL